jgi:HTH-like domain
VGTKRTLIEPDHPLLSLRRQCALLGLHRSGWYYEPAPESAENLQLMRLIDEQYTRTPFYGWPRMTVYLREDKGYAVNHKRVQRLMQLMGLLPNYRWARFIPNRGRRSRAPDGSSIRICCAVWRSSIRIKCGARTLRTFR